MANDRLNAFTFGQYKKAVGDDEEDANEDKIVKIKMFSVFGKSIELVKVSYSFGGVFDTSFHLVGNDMAVVFRVVENNLRWGVKDALNFNHHTHVKKY